MGRALAAGSLLALLVAAPVAAQAERSRPGAPPKVTARSFAGGSAKVTVTGGFQIDAEIPINTMASTADGEMTWLQFGQSGSKDPNALVTISPQEIGVSVAHGTKIFIAEAEKCSGKIEVTSSAMTGQYRCKGVTSYDPGTGKMSPVDAVISFVAKS